MCLEFAKILDLPADHIIPVTEVPEGVHIFNTRKGTCVGVLIRM